MSTPHEHAVKVLNSLIETTLDSANGYKEAAHSSQDGQYKTMFSERSLKRMKITGELQQEVRTFGGEPEPVRARQGPQHFVDLKAAVLGHDEKAIVNEVERGEDFIKAKFEKALAEDDLPATVREVVSRAFADIKSNHNSISALKKTLN